MSNPIRQHHVPRLYLKNFSFAKNNSLKVYAREKINGNVFETNIEDIAVEKNFYTVSQFSDKYIWEKLYANIIEPQMSKLLTTITAKDSNPLIVDNAAIIQDEEKCILANCLIYQMMRSKNFREYELKLYEEIAPQILDQISEDFSVSGKSELAHKVNQISLDDENIFKSVAFNIAIDEKRINKFASILYNKAWLFYHISGDRQFITSDNPIMLINGSTLEVTPFKNGIGQDKTVICFPISPKLLLIMYSYNQYFGVMKDWDKKRIILSSDKESKFIDIQNIMQYRQCNRFAISQERKFLN